MAKQATPSQSGASAPGGTGTTPSGTSPLAWRPSRATLGRLYDLPPEVRAMIYHRVLDLEDTMPMVRHLVYSASGPDFHVQSANLANRRPQSWSLLTAIPEALSEALRLGWIQLPTRLVTFPGASVAHPDRGLLNWPLEGRPVGGANPRLFNPATNVFYVDWESLVFLAPMVAIEHEQISPPDHYDRLTDIVLESRSFENLFRLPRRLGSDRPQPLDALPGLRRLIVGFLCRWQDVIAVEGEHRDVTEEARVDVHYAPNQCDSRGEPVVQRVDVQLENDNPPIELMISETVRHTTRTVRALNRAGVEVVWAFIRRGVTRRLDIEAGAHHARR